MPNLRSSLALSTLSLALAAAAAPSAAGPLASAAPLEEQLREKDHKQLGEKLAAYLEANETKKDLGAALDDLDDAFEKIEKKLKGTDPLSLTEDLGRALWWAQEYDGQRDIKKGRVEAYPLERWGIEYAMHVPKKYTGKEPYPLLLCIPPEGKSAQDHLIEDWIDADLREEAIVVVVPMPSDLAMWGKRGDASAPGGGANVRIVYGDVTLKCAVDFDKVFLVGTGAGVAAAGQIASESPDWFAGVIGRSGDLAEDLPAHNFKNLPSLFVSGAKGVSEFEKRVKELDYGNCTNSASGGEPEVLAFVRATTRNANPEHVVLVSGSEFVNKAYWIDVPAAEGERRIDAKIDRESNTITIEGEGSESVTLLLNDELVDLGRPVKVVCNGLAHQDEIPRNMKTMLDMIWKRRSDPGKVYVATWTYDLPESSSK